MLMASSVGLPTSLVAYSQSEMYSIKPWGMPATSAGRFSCNLGFLFSSSVMMEEEFEAGKMVARVPRGVSARMRRAITADSYEVGIRGLDGCNGLDSCSPGTATAAAAVKSALKAIGFMMGDAGNGGCRTRGANDSSRLPQDLYNSVMWSTNTREDVEVQMEGV